MQDIRSRVSDALRSRLSPVGPVAVKQLAGNIGRSGEAVRQWLNGEAGMKVEDLAAVARCLHDPSIIAEILGDAANQTSARALWFTESGALREAVAGHGEFARRYFGLSPLVKGDPAVYAMRNSGWLELSVSGRSARLRYYAKALASAAAGAARQWLLSHSASIASVTRSVMIGAQWCEASGLSVDGVASELALVAGPPVCRPSTERKPLDLLPAKLGAIFRAWQQMPDDTLNAAGAVGLAGRASIFTADTGGNVCCQWLGPSIKIPREPPGSNLRSWRDPIYGDELRRSVLDARAEEVTYTRLDIPIYGVRRQFDRLALRLEGSVVTVTEIRPDGAIHR